MFLSIEEPDKDRCAARLGGSSGHISTSSETSPWKQCKSSRTSFLKRLPNAAEKGFSRTMGFVRPLVLIRGGTSTTVSLGGARRFPINYLTSGIYYLEFMKEVYPTKKIFDCAQHSFIFS